MRRCDHCGAQYGDKVSICPADGLPTVNPQAKPGSVFGSVSGQAAFNVKVVSPVSAAGSYRVFVQGGDLFFIQMESGSNQILNALVPLLGPFGGLANVFGWLFSRRKTNDFNERLQSADPENLLRDSKKNFRFHLAEIRQAVIEPATASSGRISSGTSRRFRKQRLKTAGSGSRCVAAQKAAVARFLRPRA